jgi:hypothetical protein
VHKLRVACRNFYVEALKQIQQRFKFDDPVFEIMSLLEPSNARQLKPNSLAGLFKRFPSLGNLCDKKKAESEWREQSLLAPRLFGCDSLDEVKGLTVEKYWKTIFQMETIGAATRTPRFPELANCISFLFCLSSSNAVAERLFSLLKLIKTDRRTRLHDRTVSSFMRVIYWLKNQKATAATVDIPEDLIDSVMKVKANQTISGATAKSSDEDDLDVEF